MDAQKSRWPTGSRSKLAVAQLKGAVKVYRHSLLRPGYLPRVGATKPVVRLFVLPAIPHGLPEDAVFVAQAVPQIWPEALPRQACVVSRCRLAHPPTRAPNMPRYPTYPERRNSRRSGTSAAILIEFERQLVDYGVPTPAVQSWKTVRMPSSCQETRGSQPK